MLKRFKLISATVPGREHVGAMEFLGGTPNQDTHFIHQDERCVLCAVVDGASCGKDSHVGAWMAAKAIELTGPETIERVKKSSLLVACEDEKMARRSAAMSLARAMEVSLLDRICLEVKMHAAESEQSTGALICDTLLFTFLALVIVDDWYAVFGLGDGVLFVNGEVQVISSTTASRPCFISYALFEGNEWAKKAKFHVFHVGRTEELKTFGLATDGALHLIAAKEKCYPARMARIQSLSECVSNPALYDDPSALQSFLRTVNAQGVELGAEANRSRVEPWSSLRCGYLPDDTTFILGRAIQ